MDGIDGRLYTNLFLSKGLDGVCCCRHVDGCVLRSDDETCSARGLVYGTMNKVSPAFAHFGLRSNRAAMADTYRVGPPTLD